MVVIRSKDGTLRAMVAKCLHQGGPLDKGKLYEHMTPGALGEYVPKENCEILKCPWHGYEYETSTGCVVADPSRRLQLITVREEGDEIVVELAPPGSRSRRLLLLRSSLVPENRKTDKGRGGNG